MKNLSLIAALAATLFASACSSSQQSANKNYGDDVYTAGNNTKEDKATSNTASQSNVGDYSKPQEQVASDGSQSSDSDSRFDYGTSESSTDKDGNTYVTNNYYNDDDYYDYAYTARIRRFNRPIHGYGYYDPFYTNSYWYDHNPHNYGVSIYLGYNWWAPSAWYAPGYCSFSYGYSPYNYWWSNPYDYYGYNYHGYGHGHGYHHGYHHGYNNGYWNGYYDGLYAGGYNPYYFNSYDQYSYNDYYYGPRRNASSNRKRNESHYSNRSIAQTYHNAVVNDVQHVLPVSNTFASTMVTPTNTVTPRGGKTNTSVTSDPRPAHNSNAVETNPRGNTDINNYSTPKDVKNNTSSDPRPVKKNNDINNNSNNNSFDENPRGNTNPDPRPIKNNDVKNPRGNDNTNYESTPRPKKNETNDYNYSSPNNNTYESTPRPRKNDVKENPAPKNNHESTPRPRKQDNYEKPKSVENNNPAPRQERNNSFERPKQSAPSSPAPQQKRENNNNKRR